MPETISLDRIRPEEITVEFQPETIALADVNPAEIKIEREVRPRRTLSPVESAISGTAQMLTRGWADEIAAGIRAGASKLMGSEKGLSDLYTGYRDEQRAHMDAAQVDNPKSFFGGQVAGALTLPAATTIKGAAAMGGLIGAGASKANPLESPNKLKEFATDAATGAALGGTFQLGANKIASFFKSLKPENLKAFSEDRAVKAAGAMGKEFKELVEAGKLHETGRAILDNKLIKLFGSLEDTSQKAQALKKSSGETIGNLISSSDDLVTDSIQMINEGKLFGFLPDEGKQAAKKFIAENFQADMRNVASRIRSEIIEPNKQLAAFQAEIPKLEKLANFIEDLGVKNIAHLGKQKTAQGRITKFASETVPEAFKQDIYNIYRSEMENVMGRIGNLDEFVSQKSGMNLDQLLAKKLPGLAPEGRANLIQEAFKQANKDYGVAKTVSKMADKRRGQVSANQQFGLKETILTAGGVASGNAAQTVAIPVLASFVKKYGNTAQAIGADKLYQVLSKSPTSLGKFGAQLESAAEKSPVTLLMTHRLLMKNPDYQNILINFEPEQRGIRLPEQKGRGIELPKASGSDKTPIFKGGN